jgi:glycosyltransferase involved in cell wall biosynthesis
VSTISLCLIVKNEEKILEQALDSIYKIADEIIIVDTGSTDKTIDIAKKYTNKVYHFKWIDDFSAARNYAQSFATKEYILRWDADWILRDSQKSITKLQQLKKQNFNNADIVNFTWNLEFGEGGRATRQQLNFFFYKREKYHWESPVHNELVKNDSKAKLKSVDYLDIEVDHLKDPVEKAWRYDQTKKIIEGELAKKPNDLKMLMCYSDSLIFEKNYPKAETFVIKALNNCSKDNTVNIIYCLEKLCQTCLHTRNSEVSLKYFQKYEKIISKEPRFILIYADMMVMIDTEKATELYNNFLNSKATDTFNGMDFLPERFNIYPHLMLGKLYFQQKKYSKSRKHLKFVIKNSIDKETVSTIKPLYFLTTFLQFLG